MAEGPAAAAAAPGAPSAAPPGPQQGAAMRPPPAAKALSFTERRKLPSLSVPTQVRTPVPKEPRAIRSVEAPETFEDHFAFKEQLDVPSGQSRVFRATCRKTGAEVIVKMRSRKFAVGGESVWRSLLTRMLNMEGHNHVLGLHDVLADSQAYYLVMERCSGGELFDFLQTETDVPERECKRIMREILQAVDHIHSRGLIHRDIKPENIMFHDTTSDPSTPTPLQEKKTIKLIDFDTCLEYEANSPRAEHIVGTIGYIAPEALKGDYSPASDLWSVGVIFYILMTGDMPFDSELFLDDPGDTRCGSATMEELYQKLKDVHIDFESEPWPSFPQACDLCRKLLALSPGDRSPSARAALSHPWLQS